MTYSVSATGLATVPFRVNLTRDEAIAVASDLARSEGFVYIQPTDPGKRPDKIERVNSHGGTEPWLLDSDGTPLCNG
jgi:hypothetical protein